MIVPNISQYTSHDISHDRSHPGGIPRQLGYSDVGLHEHSHDERCRVAEGLSNEKKQKLVDDQKVASIHEQWIKMGSRIVKHMEMFELLHLGRWWFDWFDEAVGGHNCIHGKPSGKLT